MDYKVEMSIVAHQDTDGILEYLINNLSSPKAAKHFYKLLSACHKRLKRSPFMYPLCRDDELAKQGFRCASIMRYIVFYKIDENAKSVKIYRIIHGTMNYLEMNL